MLESQIKQQLRLIAKDLNNQERAVLVEELLKARQLCSRMIMLQLKLKSKTDTEALQQLAQLRQQLQQTIKSIDILGTQLSKQLKS